MTSRRCPLIRASRQAFGNDFSALTSEAVKMHLVSFCLLSSQRTIDDFSTVDPTLHCNSKFIKEFEKNLISHQNTRDSFGPKMILDPITSCSRSSRSRLHQSATQQRSASFYSLVSPALNSHPQRKTCLRTQSLANCNLRPCRTPNLTSYFSLPTHIPEA
jgi:hypothetical protein